MGAIRNSHLHGAAKLKKNQKRFLKRVVGQLFMELKQILMLQSYDKSTLARCMQLALSLVSSMGDENKC